MEQQEFYYDEETNTLYVDEQVEVVAEGDPEYDRDRERATSLATGCTVVVGAVLGCAALSALAVYLFMSM